MSILGVDVHSMSVRSFRAEALVGKSMRCTQVADDIMVWQQINEEHAHRILRMNEYEFRGKVFLTSADGGQPDFLSIPHLRFYELDFKHVSTICVAADGTPWISCDCEQSCGTCTDFDAPEKN